MFLYLHNHKQIVFKLILIFYPFHNGKLTRSLVISNLVKQFTFWTSSKFRIDFHRGVGGLQKWRPEPGWRLFRTRTSLFLILLILCCFRFLLLLLLLLLLMTHWFFDFFQVGAQRYLASRIICCRRRCCCCLLRLGRHHGSWHHFQLTPLENFLGLCW